MDRRFRQISLLSACLLAGAGLRALEPRPNQAREFDRQSQVINPSFDTNPLAIAETSPEHDDESFGVQQLLRDADRLRPFRTFADISAFVTSNVALTPRHPTSDSFLIATFGFEYRRPLPHGLQIDASLRVASFHYSEFNELNFTSVDAGVGVTYHTPKLGGLDFFLRYNFNQLISSESEETFFKNHAITLGVQKTIPFSQAHYAFVGASGQLGFADPKISQRSEVAAYVGYHLQATRNLEADLLFRYAFLFYTEQDLVDRNQTISLGLRYRFTDWCSVTASSYVGWNQSELRFRNYDVANGGGGIVLSLQF